MDTRLFLHVKDAVQNGFENVMIRTVDTDVLILSTLYNSLNAQTLWVDFGMGKNRCYIPVHDIVLDPIRRKGLRFFYSLTGCDQVSFFSNVTKNTAWKIWQVFPEVNETFATLSDEPTEDCLRNALPLIERFVILHYNQTSNCMLVNECRKELFCKGRAIVNIPPTQAALFQQMKRAAYFAGFVWKRSLCRTMLLPLYTFYGFTEAGKPYWTDLPEASRAVRFLKKCNSKTGCTRNCGCKPLACTELCGCKGNCSNKK